MLPRQLSLVFEWAPFDRLRSPPIPPNTGPWLGLQSIAEVSFPEIGESLVGARPLGFTKLNRKAW